MKHLFHLAVCAATFGIPTARAAFPEAYIYVDVEFKVLVPTNTALAGTTTVNSNTKADTLIDNLNDQLGNCWRGLRCRRFGDVQSVTAAAVGDSDDAGTVNDIDEVFRLPGESRADWLARGTLVMCFNLAKARPTEWKYRNDVCNFYILNGFPGGLGSLNQNDPTATNMLVQGDYSFDPAGHELGHWFTLPHTFLSVQDHAVPIGNLIPWGDDFFDDTLKDWHLGGYSLNSFAQILLSDSEGTYASLSAANKQTADGQFRLHYAKRFYNVAYTALNVSQKAVIDTYRTQDELHNDSLDGYNPLVRDLVANGNFGSPGSPVFFDNLSTDNQVRVLQLLSNIESYHFGKGSLTGYFSEQQSDRLCDVISQSTAGLDRSAIRGWDCGKYIFFGGPATAADNPAGSSKRPYISISSAHTAATSRAIIVGRPGTYSIGGAPRILNKAVTLRATHSGAFTIQ